MERFKEDLFRKELMPIKILMFLIYGGQATLYPYFTVHLRSLGVSVNHTAIIFGVQPIIALLVAPMIGMIADKIGNFKAIFCFFLTFSAVTSNFLLFVPPVPQSETSLRFQLDCSSEVRDQLILLKSQSCQIDSSFSDLNASLTLDFQCQKTCKEDSLLDIPAFYLQKGNVDCSSQCGTSEMEGCVSIEQKSTFEISLNIQDVNEINDTTILIRNEFYSTRYGNETYDKLQCSCAYQSCNTSCEFVTQNTVAQCEEEKNDEFGVTFWSYLGIRLVVTLGIGLVNGLFDAASMTIIQELKADVGFQRLWSTISMCIFAPISGYFVDSLDNFQPCFFMYGVLYLIAAVISIKLDLSTKIPSDNPLKNLAKLLRNPEVILLLIHIAALGICWGFLENYLFWFLQEELGSNNVVLGLTITVGNGTGIMMALISTWFTRKLGYVNVIIVAFAGYVVRFLGYAAAQNAYVCLIFEMMENFTVTLLTVGVTMYCTELAPMEMLTTIMTLWNGLHIISGRAFGSLLGGFLANKFGFRATFRFFAYGSAGFGLFYTLMYVLWLRKWRITHRKQSVKSIRKESIKGDDFEDEAMRNQAFSSLSMNCSFECPGILYYPPESKETVNRRRAMSHVPTAVDRVPASVPRHAVSFCAGKVSILQRPLSVVNEALPEKEEDVDYKGSENGYWQSDQITRF